MANMQPAPMTFYIPTPVVNGGNKGEFTADLSQIASNVNRRFYRQGLNWAVSGIKLLSPVSGLAVISKLPNTWSLSNGWEKTFRAWYRQQREALGDGGQESTAAKFNDFKIYMDSTHLTAGYGANLQPIDHLGNVVITGEWEASQLVIPNFGSPRNNYEPFIMGVGDKVGGIGVAYSLIDLYANSRSVPFSPDPEVHPDVLSTDNILNAMFDDGDNNQEILANVVGKNNDLPYDQDNYPGGPTNMPGLQIHDIAQLVSYSGATQVGTQRIKGGNFPCGLIRVEWTPETTANLVLQIELMPGPARGYLTEPMTEM